MTKQIFINSCARAEDGAESRLKEVFPTLNARRMSAGVRLAIEASGLALAASGQDVPLSGEVAKQTGLYIGTSFGAQLSTFHFLDSVLDNGPRLSSPTHFSHSVENVFCGFVSMQLQVLGPSCTITQFNLSFAGAMQAAISALRSGIIQQAVVGAVDESTEPFGQVCSALSIPAETSPPVAGAVFFMLSTQGSAGSVPVEGLEYSQHKIGDGSYLPVTNAGSAVAHATDLAELYTKLCSGESSGATVKASQVLPYAPTALTVSIALGALV